MKLSVFVLLITAVPVCAVQAQVKIAIHQDILTRSDTAWVDVVIEVPENDPEVKAISAYQFEVHTTDGLRFIRADETYSLTDRAGWTSGFNASNGKVGAFSSSADAFLENGVLVRLQFVLSRTDTSTELELFDFRLNSGNPDHSPAVPSLRLDLTSHDE